MTSYLLENYNYEKDIQSEWTIESLHVLSESLNDISNIVRKIKWNVVVKLEVSGETYSQYGYGETVLDVSNLNYNELIPFEDLTLDTIVSWIKSQSDIEDTLKTQLLDMKIYVTNVIPLPWKTSEILEEIESNVEIISKNFSEQSKETPVEPILEESSSEPVSEIP